MRHQNIAAVVVAAGLSSRMRDIKPLLKLGRSTVLERVTESLLLAGVYNITLVTGAWRNEIMADYLFRSDVKEAYNPDYETGGMFSSIRTGVRALPENIDAFLLLPGDFAAVKPETIFELIRFFMEDMPAASIVQPAYQGVGGYPILFSKRLIPEILSDDYVYRSGIRSVIERFSASTYKVPIEDRGVLLDMNERADYYRMEDASEDRDRSHPLIAEELLNRADIPQHIKEHCVFVAKITGVIVDALKEMGHTLDRDAAYSAALLHDIARLSGERHASEGKTFAFDRGLVRAGAIIGSHMGDGINEKLLTEREIVFLADKYAIEDILISLDRRFDRAEYRHREEGAHLSKIKHVRMMTREIKTNIERIIRRPLDPLLTKRLQD